MAADSLKLPSPFVASLYTFLFSRCIILYQSLRYLNLVLYLPFVSIAAFFRGNVGRFWSHELRRRMARRMMNLLNPRQLSYVLVPSSRKAKKVILYFHGMTCPLENGPCSSFNRVRETKAASAVGGGYGLPASEGHPAFLMQCLERLAETGKIVVAAFLEYVMYKIF